MLATRSYYSLIHHIILCKGSSSNVCHLNFSLSFILTLAGVAGIQKTMVVVLPRAASIKIREYGITHILRIPFATAKSTPQLLRSIERVAQDPIASALPRLAWNSPDEVHLVTKSLSLKTPSCIKAATRLLNEVTRTYSANSFEFSASAYHSHLFCPSS